MATNPMQRQARNSFILGAAVMFIVMGIIAGILFWNMSNLSKEIKDNEAKMKNVYVLGQDVKSGQVLTSEMFVSKRVRMEGAPADSYMYDKNVSIIDLIGRYTLCDKAGNNIYTDADGSLYMMIDGKKVPVLQEAIGTYYTQEANGEKKYIETTQKALIAKVDMKANTVITNSLISRADEIDTDDVRTQEYNMLVLPTDLITGEYVDIRLMLPNGQDYIITSKKMVTVPMTGDEYVSDTIQVKMAEEEILSMSNAIVEAYKIEGSKLYVTRYTDAGLQAQASPTYVVNAEVAKLIDADPNIVAEARKALRERYTEKAYELRNQHINAAVQENAEDAKESVVNKMEESITSTQESRQEYLQSLVTVPTTSTTSTTTTN